MVTTIQISAELKEKLALRKRDSKDTYEGVIWDLLEDTMELSEQTKKAIKKARADFKKGKFIDHEKLKKELGL
jgi:predicted transcriptional regulator